MPRISHADSKVWYQRIILQRLGPAESSKNFGRCNLATPGHSKWIFWLRGCPAASTRSAKLCIRRVDYLHFSLCVKKWNMPLNKAGGTQRFKHSTCCKMDFTGVFDALLEAGVRDNSLPQDAKVETALHALAFHWGKVCPQQTRKIGIRLIEEAKSQFDAPGPSGGTPLHFAVNGRKLGNV